MAKFITIGERLSTTAPAVNKAFTERDPEPILARAKQQLDAGAVYLDVNIGPAENDGEDLMKWVVELLQSNFDNVPLALDTSNKKAIEAGISVYNRAKGKPIVNSADAAGRIEYLDLAAANDAICIALCNGEGLAKDNDERMMYCQTLLERGMEHGMDAADIWFDPLFLVVKGMQEKQRVPPDRASVPDVEVQDVFEFRYDVAQRLLCERRQIQADSQYILFGDRHNEYDGMPKHEVPHERLGKKQHPLPRPWLAGGRDAIELL